MKFNIKKRYILCLFFEVLLVTNIYSETVKEFLLKNYSVKFDQLLGKGGSGEIWGSKYSNAAVKIGKSKRQCEIIENEAKIQEKIYSEIKKVDTDLLSRLKVLKPKRIVENKKTDICAMEVDRLYPIKEEKYKNIITQLKLGQENLDRLEKGEGLIKGHVIGLKQLKNIVVKYPKKTDLDNIDQLFSDIGAFLAILHYYIKLDGLDTELCIVRSDPNDPSYKIFFIDFGMCNKLSFNSDNKRNSSENKIVKAMLLENIFPNPTNNSFKYFFNAYLKIANKNNFKDIAKQVMYKFITEQFLINKIISNYLITKIGMSPRRIKTLRKYADTIFSWFNKPKLKTGNRLLEQIINNDFNIKEEKLIEYLNNELPLILKELTKRDSQHKKNSLQKRIIDKLVLAFYPMKKQEI